MGLQIHPRLLYFTTLLSQTATIQSEITKKQTTTIRPTAAVTITASYAHHAQAC